MINHLHTAIEVVALAAQDSSTGVWFALLLGSVHLLHESELTFSEKRSEIWPPSFYTSTVDPLINSCPSSTNQINITFHTPYGAIQICLLIIMISANLVTIAKLLMHLCKCLVHCMWQLNLLLVCCVITCMHAVNRYCFWRHLSVCLHKISKTTCSKLM